MNYLVGDIGNTFIKISILNNRFNIKKTYNLETAKIYQKKFRNKFLKKISKNDVNKRVILSSVVPRAFTAIKENLSKKIFMFLKLKK